MSDTQEEATALERGPGDRAPSPGEQAGERIDRFELIEEIGEGGMGTVWRALQREPVRREVALKIIKLGMDTRQVVARFEAERQALALMDHPFIAKVHDAGVTETGRPYFVMELVKGSPITEFCDAEGLSTPKRLELFRQVCLAVQHAHQKGVLHRDLKPSNILVTKVDGEPQPKVIDFGIAKTMEKPLTDSSLATEAFQVMGTPEYMPPEQAAGRDVDTRADVYSLGVVLYELLTGAPPFARGTGGLDDLSKLLRQIHEVTPPKPSTRVSDLGEALEGVARKRGAQEGALTRSLRGDLDWIVMKALEKDRDRRYATAIELSEDVGRHLANEPVIASPPSTSYRLKKFVRRNRLAVGSSLVVALTVVGATIGLAILYSRSVASEMRATQKSETSRQALEFMIEMFEVSDPSQARGETVTAREILDRGADRIDRELIEQPEVRSTLAAAMGSVYRGLGLFGRAEELFDLARKLRTEMDGEEDPETLRILTASAAIWDRQSRFEEAEAVLRKTLEQQKRILEPGHVDTIDTRLVLSRVLEQSGNLEEAEALTREALSEVRQAYGPGHELTLVAVNRIGGILEAMGRYEEAETEMTQGLLQHRLLLGSDHPGTLALISGLAGLYTNMGRFEEAEKLILEAQETALRVFGDDHPEFIGSRSRLVLLYRQVGRLEEAEELCRANLEVRRRVLGDRHLDTLLSLNILGAVLSGQSRFSEAEEAYLESYEGLSQEIGEVNRHTLSTIGNLAVFYLQTDQLDEAERWGEKAYEGSKAHLGEDHPETILRLENLANVFYKQGDESRVVEILNQVLEGRRRALGNEHPAVTRTLVNLSVVRGSMGDQEGATAVREELLERTLAGLGFDYASVAEEIEDLARDLAVAGEFERASVCLDEILRIRLETLGDEDPLTLQSMRDSLQVAVKLERWDVLESIGTEYFEAHLRVLGAADGMTVKCQGILVDGFEASGNEAQAAVWRAALTGSGD